MEKVYRLFEVEEVIAEMDLSDIDDDIAETDEEYQIVVHDFSDMFDFTVEGDPNNSLEKYEKFIRVMRGEETGDEEA